MRIKKIPRGKKENKKKKTEQRQDKPKAIMESKPGKNQTENNIEEKERKNNKIHYDRPSIESKRSSELYEIKSTVQTKKKEVRAEGIGNLD